VESTGNRVQPLDAGQAFAMPHDVHDAGVPAAGQHDRPFVALVRVDDVEQEARQVRAQSFGAVAGHYDAARPGYPDEAIAWILGDPPLKVADLGAGTGIFSRQLLANGHDVVAIEPDPQMRRRLTEVSPGLTTLAGSAESIPLPDASVDAVTAAQAYHWFDPERAHSEIARVLRPGGVFGPVWNVRDDEVPWVRELSQLLDRVPGHDGGDGGVHQAWRTGMGHFGPAYEPTERELFRHATQHTADTLVGLVKSRSYYLTADADAREAIEAAVRELVSTHADLAGRETFELPYVTVAYRARRR
jgi:SAM-dependent methyltransferase